MIDPAIEETALQELEEKRIQLKKGSGISYLFIAGIPILASIFLLYTDATGPGIFVSFVISCLFAGGMYYAKFMNLFVN
ncbi:MAG: hypothetical protein ACJA01_001291 [Saprospiraceae bacterium]|jgi:hypothetical protein